jgi:hypothetical protein
MEKMNTEFNNDFSDRGPYLMKEDDNLPDNREYL